MPSRPPLAGVRVLDFTALLPGAMCTLYLADLGADVIKVEPPVTGEAARGPAGTPPGGIFHVTNRNKRSITLDLKNPEQNAQARRLIAESDVMVESFRPGVMARLGLDYATMAALNPRLVYCSITGYGQQGPMADKAGHDINYQAMAGVAAQNVVDGSRPSPGGSPWADLAGGGLSAALGIMTALFDATRTGQGRHVDIAMTDCVMALNVAALSSKMMFGGGQPEPGRDILSGGLPCYGTYATADGRHLAFGALEHKFWHAFCQAVERPDLERRGWDMGPRRDAAVEEIAALVRARTFAEWTALLGGVDACVTPVLTLDESLDAGRERGMVIDVSGGGATTTQYVQPIRMTDYAFSVALPPPVLGEHNDQILAPAG